MKHFRMLLLAGALLSPAPLLAAPLLTSVNGDYGQVALNPNDDGFTGAVDLPFALNFFGTTYNQFYINNNGNVTFEYGMGAFTPFNLASLDQAMIAPYWGDVDTRGALSGLVYVGSFAPGMISVTWDHVGYYGSHDDKLNSFQLNLYQVGDQGDFDIEFRYADLQWTTGDASEGINGLGGIPAIAGYTDGFGHAVLQPGSFLSPGALNMAVESNLTPEEPGRWVYNIRGDALPPEPGSTPDNPILPTGGNPEEGYEFTFDVDPNVVYFYDPPVATGYDFLISGAQITSALFPTLLSDPDGYQLFDLSWNFLGTVAVGGSFNFATPLSGFYLRGIDPANLLAPGDPTAFVFGLVFNQGGTVTVTQVPFVEDYTPPGSVPEPASWAMMICGFAALGGVMRRRQVGIRFA